MQHVEPLDIRLQDYILVSSAEGGDTEDVADVLDAFVGGPLRLESCTQHVCEVSNQ